MEHTKMQTYSVRFENQARDHVDLGYCDEKGRACGLSILTQRVTYSAEDPATPQGARFGYLLPAGLTPGAVVSAYAVTLHKTKDGAAFGPCQPYQVFATPEQRERAIERRIASMRKRGTRGTRVCPGCGDSACETKSPRCGQ